VTEPDRYLTKARESLASAEADVAAGRYNSAANRAYYAAFQAAVASLIRESIRPESGNWQHRFVLRRFSSTLIRHRKRLPADLSAVFDDLFRTRIQGDYEPNDVSRRQAARVVKGATRFVDEVERMMKLRTFREASAEYEAEIKEGQKKVDEAEGFVNELQSTILDAVPGAEFSLSRLGPTDYRMYAIVDTEDDEIAVRDALDSRTTDILCEHGIWIVVLPRRREEVGA
jgi:uncharacterized protein (UPF0332 family)